MVDDPAYNAERGTLLHLLPDSGYEGKPFAHWKQAPGLWASREDVFIVSRGEVMAAPSRLTVGFGGGGQDSHMGVELEIGTALGEMYADPVLLIKISWGGRSLSQDFRPPSASGETGPDYTNMIALYREALAAVPFALPTLSGLPTVLEGFVWFQGWNDLANPSEYAQLLELLIADVRADLNFPDGVVAVGATGNGWESTDGGLSGREPLMAAQQAGVAAAGNAIFVPTQQYLLSADACPSGGLHHWHGCAESYLRIGAALGASLVEMLSLYR